MKAGTELDVKAPAASSSKNCDLLPLSTIHRFLLLHGKRHSASIQNVARHTLLFVPGGRFAENLG